MKETTNNERWLFFADTPLQIFNAVMIRRMLSCCCDIAINMQFYDAEGIANRLRESQIFNKVYLSAPLRLNSALRRRWITFISHFRDTDCVQFQIPDDYSHFALACPTIMTSELLHNLRKKNSSLQVVLFEDGTGSYNGNVFADANFCDCASFPNTPFSVHPIVRFQKFLARLFGGKKVCYNPVALYVYEENLVIFKPTFELCSLKIDSSVTNELRKIFKVTSAIPEVDYLVLDSPRKGIFDLDVAIIDNAISAIIDMGSSVAIRPHPRSTTLVEYEGIIMCSPEMWEVQLALRSGRCPILVSVGSSAMLMPKLLFKNEPPLLFLHEFISKSNEQKKYSTAYNLARSFYSDKGKVFSAACIDDIRIAVEYLNKNKELSKSDIPDSEEFSGL